MAKTTRTRCSASAAAHLSMATEEDIGKIDELYLQHTGGQPEWALVNTGLFWTKKTFVPIRSASPAGEDIRRYPSARSR